jgi:hypothetical protein
MAAYLLEELSKIFTCLAQPGNVVKVNAERLAVNRGNVDRDTLLFLQLAAVAADG